MPRGVLLAAARGIFNRMLSDRQTLIENASSLYGSGRLEECTAICNRLLELDPSDVEAMTLSGKTAAGQGRYAEAIATLDRALRLSPEAMDALQWLSFSFRKSGSLKAATGVAMRAAQLRPNDPHVLNNLGRCQMEMLMLRDATNSFERASQLRPESAEILENLGTALYMQGFHQRSAEAFRKAIDQVVSANGLVGLGRALLALDQVEEAFEFAQKAVDLDGDYSSAQQLMAQLLIRAGRSKQAQEHAERAVHLEPASPLSHAILGQVLQSQGITAESDACLLRSIELDPRQGYSYFALIFGRKVTEADRPLERQMLSLLSDRQLPQTELQFLHYALGRLYEGLAEYEKAMNHYDAANQVARFVKFRGQPFDSAAYAAARERVMSFFTADRFGAGSQSELPLFIVGMMRSGTTLMEQILSSHPDVGAAGEQTFWTEKGPSAFDPATGTLDQDRVTELAAEYLALLRRFEPDARRVTDKMPANSLALGFIHAAFPNARIIHMNRNPADVCFSIYATPNEARFEFAHDKAGIAFAFRTHRCLMEHWQNVLPADRLLDVSYEALIEDREAVTRRVLAFCGLDWSDLCLSPEKNERSVATPSTWQVRQPVYKTSIQRWKNFEPWLSEFQELYL